MRRHLSGNWRIPPPGLPALPAKSQASLNGISSGLSRGELGNLQKGVLFPHYSSIHLGHMVGPDLGRTLWPDSMPS